MTNGQLVKATGLTFIAEVTNGQALQVSWAEALTLAKAGWPMVDLVSERTPSADRRGAVAFRRGCPCSRLGHGARGPGTLGRLGLTQFQDAADHLADAWRVPQVRVEQQGRDHLTTVLVLMTARQRHIRDVLGVKNMWHVGQNVGWPLLVVIIDGA